MFPIDIPMTHSLTHLNISDSTLLKESHFASLLKQCHHLKELAAELEVTLHKLTLLMKEDKVFMEAMKRPITCLEKGQNCLIF